MKLTICICTFNRNKSLEKCIESINKIKIKKQIKINIIIVDNTKDNNLLKIKKKLIKNSKNKIIFLNEKKRGIVFARNKYLTKLKIINPDYICLFDDDCIVDKNWLNCSLKTIKSNNADVVTGPQTYVYNNNLSKKFINYSYLFEKKYGNDKIYSIKWAASNNIFMKYEIIKKNKLFFDKKLNKFGVGEDQLFFLNINNIGYKIIWNKNVKVYEKIHTHRLNLKWLIKRSFRLGVLGHYIDTKIYGKFLGYNINYIKSFFYLLKAIIHIILLPNKTSRINIINFFLRFIGRLCGPFIFNKINFLKK